MRWLRIRIQGPHGCVLIVETAFKSSAARSGRRFQKDVRWKARRDRNESSAARTIEISLGWRIDTGKIISSIRNNCYYIQVDDDDSTDRDRNEATYRLDDGKWILGNRAPREERGPSEDSDPRWWMKNHLGKKSGKDSFARGKELLIMTKGTAVRHRAYKRRGPEKGRAISYFNQIISRTMDPTGEKSSFASCFWFGRRSLPSWRVALTERGCNSTLESRHC